MLFTTAAFAALVASAAAAKDKRTFAVLHHYGKGPLVHARVDPLVNPGQPASHLHTVMGASGFSMTSTGEDLRKSTCTTALIKEDLSAYWFPSLFFQDPTDGHFEPVEMFYSNMYYFFEATNDDIKSFPLGLRMLAGNASTRVAPNKDGRQNLDPSKGAVNPLQWTCPRPNFDPPSWPAGSDGTQGGIQDPNNKGSGVGFPFANCDGFASPLRMDLHFPSCLNPAASLEDYKTNTVYPSSTGKDGKRDCPKGWIHMPHLFYEVYWNTPKFLSRWTPNSGKQPFVLSNGDATGYSGHGDFISGWNEQTLQQIIDNCDAGTTGMDKCPGLLSDLNERKLSCNIESPVPDQITGNLAKLPGNNPVIGWGGGGLTNPGSPGTGSGNGTGSTPSSTGSGSGSAAGSSTKPGSYPTPTTSAAPVEQNTKVVDPNPATTAPPVADNSNSDPTASTSTVYETITDWVTTTVFEEEPAPTDDPSADPQVVDGRVISRRNVKRAAHHNHHLHLHRRVGGGLSPRHR